MHKTINDPNGVQAAIRLARPFPGRKHPDFQRVQVLNTVFGGFFGSRLMANIREDNGYTYGIYSYLLNHNDDSAWKISTEAGRDVLDATIAEVYHEMQEMREHPVEAEELQMTKNYMIGSILGDLDGPFQVIARWRNLILHGQDEQYFYRGVSIIRDMTADEILQLAQRYLIPDTFYEVAVV
jgi:predicted Zn-dependent peptidase